MSIKTDENYSLISAFPQRGNWAYIIDHLSGYFSNCIWGWQPKDKVCLHSLTTVLYMYHI